MNEVDKTFETNETNNNAVQYSTSTKYNLEVYHKIESTTKQLQ